MGTEITNVTVDQTGYIFLTSVVIVKVIFIINLGLQYNCWSSELAIDAALCKLSSLSWMLVMNN